MISRFIPSLLLLVFCNEFVAQNTIGVIAKETNRQEYNLFFPFTQHTVYLIDNCGRIINSWPGDENVTPGPSSYLTPSGDLLVAKAKGSTVNDTIRAGGAGEFIELRDWDNKLKYQFRLNNGKARLHHDIKIMPNGNILAIAWENFTPQVAINNGRKPELITEGAIWPDYIIEINPESDKIVWEWHAWDHLIQDYDSTKLHYGVIAAHPELIDINYISTSGQADWMHSNALDYHPELDVIALSVAHFNEVWLIDHSVTPTEAKGNKGGRFGKGGDLIYRWGNPLAYKRGGVDNQQLNFQHDVRFIREGKYKDGISVFNNRYNTGYSSCSIFKPVLNGARNGFELVDNTIFAPKTFEVNFLHPKDPKLIRSSGLSSFQLTPEGHVFAFSGNQGYAVEFDDKGKIYWEYILPFSVGRRLSQGEVPTSNLAFKMEKYQSNFTGFIGKDLRPKEYLELNPSSSECLLVGLEEESDPKLPILQSTISHDGHLFLNHRSAVRIYDINGSPSSFYHLSDTEIQLSNTIPNGMYFIKSLDGQLEKFLLLR